MKWPKKTQKAPSLEDEALPARAVSCEQDAVEKVPRGVEQSANSSGKHGTSQTRDAESDAVGNRCTVDPGLRQVIAAWRTLPQALRQAILAIVNTRA